MLGECMGKVGSLGPSGSYSQACYLHVLIIPLENEDAKEAGTPPGIPAEATQGLYRNQYKEKV